MILVEVVVLVFIIVIEVVVLICMIVSMSRRIAADLYAQIIKIKPDWHSDDLDKGVIKVVMTSSSSNQCL
jgi:type I site-specific restriction-modification system R (restriction) subunit